jgi:Epoxide hydrolase N terminus
VRFIVLRSAVGTLRCDGTVAIPGSQGRARVSGRVRVEAAAVRFSSSNVAELRRKMKATRPVSFPLPGRWTFGTGADVVATILELWATFDVDALAARVNEVDQLDATIDGVRIRHFIFGASAKTPADRADPRLAQHGP